jgi:hypothetical protein
LGKSYELLDIEADFPIFKISSRVFRLDDFGTNPKIDAEFITKFCSILDLGLKFIPSIFSNLYIFFLFFLFEMDKSFTKLNSYIFFHKERLRKSGIRELNPVNKTNNNNITSKEFDFIKCILKAVRGPTPINYDNIPIQEETFSYFKNVNRLMLRSFFIDID